MRSRSAARCIPYDFCVPSPLFFAHLSSIRSVSPSDFDFLKATMSFSSSFIKLTASWRVCTRHLSTSGLQFPLPIVHSNPSLPFDVDSQHLYNKALNLIQHRHSFSISERTTESHCLTAPHVACMRYGRLCVRPPRISITCIIQSCALMAIHTIDRTYLLVPTLCSRNVGERGTCPLTTHKPAAELFQKSMAKVRKPVVTLHCLCHGIRIARKF
ncbi:hypothetical protein K437DRAFT_59807 [Tilletiaria anomala UBC 951]|uniref:Uncharacterized protein n=1 Tax=Tilletiaria anomala (strain ATCC 24038 / CBS 436.72 / UBC 951) TaxID=1037660 RepID=A0A066WA39_TILAU|nr:uncharacterized protein K437DRAFT_59807 [Tilletiaria anomala UBC 951]KDN50817.1 hypothetical protein K437DRAFT_59807 [Tilletiaria anomala UBC 951]